LFGPPHPAEPGHRAWHPDGVLSGRESARLIDIRAGPKIFGRGSWIRTNDLQYPKLPRYQAALYPDFPREEVDTRSERSQQGTTIGLDRAAAAREERCSFKRLA
jgi:hypothetical protein